MLILDLEVFIKYIFSGHLFLESKQIFFFMKIMFPALKTLVNTAIYITLRRNRKPGSDYSSYGEFFPHGWRTTVRTAANAGKHSNTS